MVGGGEGAFIGAVHRRALRLDGTCTLVCGAFSSDPSAAREFGANLGVDAARAYGSWQEMLEIEASLPDSERMEAVSVVTPNHLHLPIATAALHAGFHVVSDKPATISLSEARELATAVEKSGRCYVLTHTYLGYPMVREARRLVQEGVLGRVRKVYVEYTQGWLVDRLEKENKQAAWRVDPARSGPSGCMGDIGSHAHNITEFITGARMETVRAWLQCVVEGRALDDDGAVFFKMSNGATGVLTASQICAGEENFLAIRVYGEKAGLIWNQEEPNTLMIKYADGQQKRVRAGVNMPLGATALDVSRTPSGHPEGYLGAFSTLYTDFAKMVRNNMHASPGPDEIGYTPGIDAALRGMAFIEAVVDSSNADGEWRDVVNVR
ncbi:MAG: Gfo/Idh/MocA family oxidoreductase [Pseudomonadota bacterium]